jgi:hypothetical protein
VARLTSLEKGGYYAFPDEYLPLAASLFQPSRWEDGIILDPCAGEGRALQHLSAAWNLKPYANELDNARSDACRALFGRSQAARGDIFTLRMSLGSSSVVWCNPPYTWDVGSDEKRRELGMLKHSWKWVQPGGFMVWVVYAHHVSPEAALFLAKNSRSVDVWALPGQHLGRYTHVVVVAQIGRAERDEIVFAQQIVEQGRNPRPITEADCGIYALPEPRRPKNFVFCPSEPHPDDLAGAIAESGAQHQVGFQLLLEPPRPEKEVRPIVRPRGGQLALILAAGLFNGIVLETDSGRAAIRSTVETVQEEVGESAEIEDEDGNSVESNTPKKEIYRTSAKVTITTMTEMGEVADLSGDEALVEFIKQYKSQLMAYLDEYFKPLYNFDYGPLAPILNSVRLSGNPLYETQKHVIASAYAGLSARKGMIVVGEPGVGKTAIGSTLALIMARHMREDQVVIISCPPHLVRKWKREVERVADSTGYAMKAEILRRVVNVRQFMDADWPGTLKIGIISREMMKAGEGWEPSVYWRLRHTARWDKNERIPYGMRDEKRVFSSLVPTCPNCGEGIVTTVRGEDKYATKEWLQGARRKCEYCGGALWQFKRTFSKPKPGQKEKADKNPRMPLADYISQVYPDRVYLYLADEVHESKSSTTDQGAAMMTLAQTAEKVVGLTGTLYGGVASSLYGLEYAFNPRMHMTYPWGRGKTLWVKDMGTFEKVIEYKDTYSSAGVFTGIKRVEHKTREMPGCSPLLVREIIDHTVFVGLQDIGRDMPPFEEVPVPIAMSGQMELLYGKIERKLKSYLAECFFVGDNSFLGRYLQTLLSWASACFRPEKVIHRKQLGERRSQDYAEIKVMDIEGLGEAAIYPKEQWLIDTINEELATGRGVGVFVRQTGERDIQDRLLQLISTHCPDAKPFVLKGVDSERREEYVEKKIGQGHNVMICNPRLVQTGLDLVDFPTLIFYEVDYSLFVMIQASRRAWRIIQDRPCKVYYPFYEGTMEQKAIELIGLKARAAALLTGDEMGGLSELTSPGGGADLLAELAKTMNSDSEVVDLRDLFKKSVRVQNNSGDWGGSVEIAQLPSEKAEAVARESEEVEYDDPEEIPYQPMADFNPAALVQLAMF